MSHEKAIERYYETKLFKMYKANQELIAITEKLCDFINSKGLTKEFKKFKEIKK